MNDSDKRMFHGVCCRAENKFFDVIRFAQKGREQQALEALSEGLLMFNSALHIISKYHSDVGATPSFAADSFIRAGNLARKGRGRPVLEQLAKGLKMSLVVVMYIGDP